MRRDVEDEEGYGADGDAGEDQVDGVEEGLAADGDVELDICVTDIKRLDIAC